jgi:2-keto-4-pentenoate hydratase/2-oxohepta-3-ene-1,7-dioic acid hydratase in catechol pathway
MKITTFTQNEISRVGIITEHGIIDTLNTKQLPTNIEEFLASYTQSPEQIRKAADRIHTYLNLEEVTLQAPVPRPGKFLGVGLNYLDHVRETGRERPALPTVFNKQITCVVGPGAAIHKPRVSEQLDYEGELGIIIGRRCHRVPRDQAHKVIAGYLAVNDVSVRDWQARSPTMTLGKSFDTHGPTGPWIVTADVIGDPHALDIKTSVNDVLRQSFNTRDMVFDCYFLVEYLSSVFTLEPGDIITTGTGSGVGSRMTPPGYLKPGDTVTVEIQGIGCLRNPVIEEPATVHTYI